MDAITWAALQARMHPIAVKPHARVLSAVNPSIDFTTRASAMIFTRKVPSAATIIACGLTFAARPTTTMLIPKKTVTIPTPASAPYSPLTPTSAAQIATMIAAAMAVATAARRAITA